MIGILKFKLPEEREEFELAQKAIDYSIVLDEFDNWLRGLIKYGDAETIELQVVRDKLREFMSEREI